MNRHVNAIAGRLSLRAPQRESLVILDRVTEIAPPSKSADIDDALRIIQAEFPSVTDFEREFPSLCFALATGVGKTRLMGAFVAYLHLARGINNFFVLAPNLTIYNKLIADFTPNTPKYVFKGIAEFATLPPEIITGDNYEDRAAIAQMTFSKVHINIFNISKINSEVRGGAAPRIKRLSEYIGQSYFEYLAGLPDLVLLMDESHRYRASAGVKALNELKPILGLEFTATPYVEAKPEPTPFKNVILDYPLARALEDGFVKEPAVVTQENFDASQFTPEQIERLKLEDGVRLHESVKVELETYARQNGTKTVKPFMLVIARDTTHAKQLLDTIQAPGFFEGRYKERAIQIDSSQSGAEKDEVVERLLKVESPEEPTEIVIHVNMLKEGWDVTNLYTIVPLRAANARILIEQSIGRGLRLPYGRRTGVKAVDRLNIVAHDRFQEIVDDANRPDSPIRLAQVVIGRDITLEKKTTVVAEPNIVRQVTAPAAAAPGAPAPQAVPVFATPEEQKIAQLVVAAIQKHESLPRSSHLERPEVQALLLQEVKAAGPTGPVQESLPGVLPPPDIATIIQKTTKLYVQQTIDIPRIVVLPKGEVTTGFRDFDLEPPSARLQPVDRNLLIQHLRTHERETLTSKGGMAPEKRPEDYLIRALVDFDDVSYHDHADLLYKLAGQMVAYLRTYLSEEDAVNVLQYHQRELAELVHVQMQAHHWEKASGYEASVSKGFMTLRAAAFTVNVGDEALDFRAPVAELRYIRGLVFGGFAKCLYQFQKFDSDSERRFSVVLENEAQVLKWFKPSREQFQIFYSKDGHYEPDFVVETPTEKFICEPKRADQIESDEVQAKAKAAVTWCEHATTHELKHGGKPWRYLLIPHDAIKDNMTLAGLASRFALR